MIKYSRRLALLFGVVALLVLLLGLQTMRTDATRATVRTIGIAELERGTKLPLGQHVSITGGHVMPLTVAPRFPGPNGETASHRVVAIGSIDIQGRALLNEPVQPALWVRLATAHPDEETAHASLQRGMLRDPWPLSGVLSAPPGELRSMPAAQARIGLPLYFEDGSTPVRGADGALMVQSTMVAGLVLALWAWSARRASQWLAARCPPGATAFTGRTAWWGAGVVGVVVMDAGLTAVMVSVVRSTEPAVWAIVATLAGLVVLVVAFARDRAGAVLDADTLSVHVDGRNRSIALADVTGVSIQARNHMGLGQWACTFTLQGPRGAFTVGSGLFDGGLHDPLRFGAALRDALAQRGITTESPWPPATRVPRRVAPSTAASR